MRLPIRSEEHTSELQSHDNLVCRLLLEKKKEHRHVGRFFTSWQRCAPPAAPPLPWPRCALPPHPRRARFGVSGSDFFLFFFFNDRAPPEISPLPLPDALPIWACCSCCCADRFPPVLGHERVEPEPRA